MLTGVLQGLVDKYNLEGVHIDEAIGGAIVTHSKDWNLAREAVLGTKLAPTTPGITIQQACGTSLQAASMIQAKIATGEIECGIAMGSDTTSDAPIVLKERFAHRLIEAQNAKSMGQRLSAFKGFSPAELVPQPPNVGEPRTGLSGPTRRVDGAGMEDHSRRAGPIGLREPQEGRRGLPLRLHG